MGEGTWRLTDEVRQRLARAGILASIPAHDATRPDSRLLEAARAAAGQGTPLSAHVIADRD